MQETLITQKEELGMISVVGGVWSPCGEVLSGSDSPCCSCGNKARISLLFV